MFLFAIDAVLDCSTYRNIFTLIYLVIGRCHWKLFSTVPIEVAEQNTSAAGGGSLVVAFFCRATFTQIAPNNIAQRAQVELLADDQSLVWT
jgi:hypothetical protein